MPDLIDVIDDRIDKKQPPPQIEGVIFSLEAGVARIRVNNQIKRAYYNVGDPQVQAGKACIALWSKRRNAYIIQSVYSNALGTAALGARPPTTFELAPPAGLNTKALLPGYLTAEWKSPPQSPVAFEVQFSETGSDVDALVALVTRGSYAFIAVTGVSGSVRVRSVDDQFRHSSWTAWVSGVPGTGSIPNAEERVVVYDDDTGGTYTVPIPTGFTQLEVILSRARTDAESVYDPVHLTLNGDSDGGNYHYLLPTNNGVYNDDTGDNHIIGYACGDSAEAGYRSAIRVFIPDVDSSDAKHVQILNGVERRGASDEHIVRWGDLHWEGTDPITELSVFPEFGMFLPGTRLRIIGIR